MHQVEVPDDRGNQLCLLQVRLPDGYPTHAPPNVELQARKLDPRRKVRLLESLQEAMDGWKGETCLFQIVEWIRERKDEWFEPDAGEPPTHVSAGTVPTADEHAFSGSGRTREEGDGTDVPRKHVHVVWHTGEPLTDRKSTFQAHLVGIDDPGAVSDALDVLFADRKIRGATHNVLAYRISLPTGGFSTDCDDDGECAAGGRLLHLLQVVDARDVLVVVSRWYGGTKLGPDRFKRISQVARDLLDRQGHVRGSRRP
eukprot:scaffold1204_cov313-Pavlova_lutheri.AAC.11